MIGLEYIAKENQVSLSEIGKILGISRKSISNWTNGWQKIPKKHLSKLESYFGLDASYFQKELNEAEKLKVQIAKIQKQKNSDNKVVLDFLNTEMKKEELLMQIGGCLDKRDDCYDIYRMSTQLIDSETKTMRDALKMFLLCFNNEFGGNPFSNFENEQFGRELFQLLKSNGLVFGELD